MDQQTGTTPLDYQETQRRTVIEQAAVAAVAQFKIDNPDLFSQRETSKHSWTIVVSVLTFAICGTGAWVASSLNDLREAVAKIEVRQDLQSKEQERRMATLEKRMDRTNAAN